MIKTNNKQLEGLCQQINEVIKNEQQYLNDERKEIEVERMKMTVEHQKAINRLATERAIFEEEKQQVSAMTGSLKSKIKLDIGGTFYTTSRTTLTSVPGSMLDAMFSGRHILEEDEAGRVFIDRDGATFKLVLEYLRSPPAFSIEGLAQRETANCIAEFQFFGLPSPRGPTILSPLPSATHLEMEEEEKLPFDLFD